MSKKNYESRINELTEAANKEVNLPFKTIKDDYKRLIVAALLEKERGRKHANNINAYRELIIPTSVHIVTQLPLDFFSLQISKTDEFYYFEKAGNPDSISSTSTLKMNYDVMIMPHIKGEDSFLNMPSKEFFSIILEISTAMSQEIFRFILSHMYKNKTVLSLKESSTDDEIINNIQIQSETIHRKIGKSANFLLMHPQLAYALRDQIKTFYDFEDKVAKCIGVVKNRWKAFITDFAPPNEIVVGYRGTHPVDAGLAFVPETFFTVTKDNEKGKTIAWNGCCVSCNNSYFRTIVLKHDKKFDTFTDL